MNFYIAYLSLLYSFLILYSVKKAKWENRDLKITLDLDLILMIFGFVGARLMHVFFENPEHYVQNWWQVFAIWQGGFVFYGGALLAAGASFLYLLYKKQPILDWLDFFAPIIALGYGLGRISCWIAGCCYGKYCDLPWAIEGRHPTQIYATVWELVVFAILVFFRKKLRTAGVLFSIWLCLHSIGRMLMESFRDDFRGDLIFGMSISSFISLVLFSASVTMLVQLVYIKKAKSISKN
jgi:phosphatidylglycerol:prolipoprotein diacylglycerol transferase